MSCEKKVPSNQIGHSGSINAVENSPSKQDLKQIESSLFALLKTLKKHGKDDNFRNIALKTMFFFKNIRMALYVCYNKENGLLDKGSLRLNNLSNRDMMDDVFKNKDTETRFVIEDASMYLHDFVFPRNQGLFSNTLNGELARAGKIYTSDMMVRMKGINPKTKFFELASKTDKTFDDYEQLFRNKLFRYRRLYETDTALSRKMFFDEKMKWNDDGFLEFDESRGEDIGINKESLSFARTTLPDDIKQQVDMLLADEKVSFILDFAHAKTNEAYRQELIAKTNFDDYKEYLALEEQVNKRNPPLADSPKKRKSKYGIEFQKDVFNGIDDIRTLPIGELESITTRLLERDKTRKNRERESFLYKKRQLERAGKHDNLEAYSLYGTIKPSTNIASMPKNAEKSYVTKVEEICENITKSELDTSENKKQAKAILSKIRSGYFQNYP